MSESLRTRSNAHERPNSISGPGLWEAVDVFHSDDSDCGWMLCTGGVLAIS